ncbi:leucine-rich repeat-containing protein 59-like [Daphnia pulex]|uniref:leucine-rich repeat-containing protein 59-like n=1 Tax=Daphnia pulex TaxID=6669 RepID=UPI001EE13D57|nr:leucine-rich repeat-containing protein 59-like [Daphnia pulex]
MQNNKKKSVSVKDKLDGNEIDLSLLELTEAPVKELAAVTRGTVLDLSNNKLVTLSIAFPTLTHLIKLDLSKNQLKELPVNFGDLKHLRHLDLYSNELQRLPVSFHQLKELKWLDLKNNPLVSTLAEAAGDCLDQKGCQEAAKKVVKLMTVVHAELEKKRLKELEEIKSQQMAQKQEEDRAKERERQEKKAEKDKRKTEAVTKHQAAVSQAAAKKSAVNHAKSEGAKNEKKNERQQPKKMKPKVAGPSFCAKFFMLLLRLFILVGVAMAVVFALNWEGPLTLDNAGKVAVRSMDKTTAYGLEVYDWASPHLLTIREQWKQLSRFVAKNGRDIVNIAWERSVHYTRIAQQEFWVSWPIVMQRTGEVMSLTGDTAVHYWRIVCREAPIYYKELVDKVTQLFHGTQTHAGNPS